MKKRHWGLLIVIGMLVTVCSFGIKAVIDKRSEEKRQVEYQSTLKEYSNSLRPGMTRHEAESWLRLNNHRFGQRCCVGESRSAYVDLVKIGSEKAPWFCNQKNVYVALDFETAEPHG